MPRARVAATIASGGRRESFTGTGYHDHNWGTATTSSVIDHWYWGHAHLGPYTVIAVRVAANARQGGGVFPAYLVACDSEIVAEGTNGLALTRLEEALEPRSGVTVAGQLDYRLPGRDGDYRVEFARRRDVLPLGFGAAGGYLRFVGDAALTPPGGATVHGDGLWELLSFRPRAAH